MLTFLGVFLPVTFIVILGALLMTVPAYAQAYESGDAAGVLSKGAFCYLLTGCIGNIVTQVFEPWGRGGDFILVLLALSVIANNSMWCHSVGMVFFNHVDPSCSP